MAKVTAASARGVWLSAALVIFALAQLSVLFVLYLTWRDTVAHNRPGQGITFVSMALAAATLIALVGVWRWRRWGVYLFGLIMAAGLGVDLMNRVPLVVPLAKITLVAVLAEPIRDRWERFR